MFLQRVQLKRAVRLLNRFVSFNTTTDVHNAFNCLGRIINAFDSAFAAAGRFFCLYFGNFLLESEPGVFSFLFSSLSFLDSLLVV